MGQVLFFIALVVGFYMAWNIGANDVANAFGTSIGSGALTFRRAVLLAAIFEFSGAYFVGAHVSQTIRGGIVSPAIFVHSPRLFVIGMLAALLGAAIWLNIATYFSQPVSTTHAIIGAVIGFGMVAAGPEYIQWTKLFSIAASWFISPVVGALLGFLIYVCIRKFVLRSYNPVASAYAVVPLGLGAVFFVIAFSIIKHVASNVYPSPDQAARGMWIVLSASLLIAVVGGLAGRLFLRRYFRKPNHDPAAANTSVERWFGYMEVITACYMSFAHGANDVANAIAPVAGVFQALHGNVAIQAPVPAWVLAYGGLGIVLGLAMYGRKVIEAVGCKITEITPTRGFSAEFATATTVLACSMMGLPISTTFVLVGAVMGVGFARGFGAIDLSVVKRIFTSWVITIPVSAFLTMIIYWSITAIWK